MGGPARIWKDKILLQSTLTVVEPRWTSLKTYNHWLISRLGKGRGTTSIGRANWTGCPSSNEITGRWHHICIIAGHHHPTDLRRHHRLWHSRCALCCTWNCRWIHWRINSLLLLLLNTWVMLLHLHKLLLLIVRPHLLSSGKLLLKMIIIFEKK